MSITLRLKPYCSRDPLGELPYCTKRGAGTRSRRRKGHLASSTLHSRYKVAKVGFDNSSEVAPHLKSVEVRLLGSKDQSRRLLIANVQAFVRYLYTRAYDGRKDVNVAARKK